MENLKEKSSSLGNKLRLRREVLGLRILDVAEEVQANTDTVRALEEDRYEFFTAKVYAHGFFKKIVEVLFLDKHPELLKEFDHQWSAKFPREKSIQNIPENKENGRVFTLAKLGIASGGFILLVFFIFLGFRLYSFILPPGLKLSQPAPDVILKEARVEVKGSTEKESRLSVNGRELRVGEDGNFDEKIELVPGLNTLEFYVQNRFGKINKVVRYMVVNSAELNSSEALAAPSLPAGQISNAPNPQIKE